MPTSHFCHLTAAACCIVAVSLGLSATYAEDAADEGEAVKRIDVELSRSQVQAIWSRNWRDYASRVLLLEEGFAFCPSFDRRYPSSRGITASDLIRQSRRGSQPTMPRAEAQSGAAALPRLEVGQYGYVHSVRIVEIRGPQEMLIDQMRLIDATELNAEVRAERMRLLRAGRDRRQIDQYIDALFGQRQELAARQRDRDWRQQLILRGFPTADLQEGTVWNGPRGGLQIAIAWEPPEQQHRFRRDPMIAVRADMFGEGVTASQFVRMLALSDHTIESFCALVYQQRQDAPDREHESVFNTLRTDRDRVLAANAEPAPRSTPTWRR